MKYAIHASAIIMLAVVTFADSQTPVPAQELGKIGFLHFSRIVAESEEGRAQSKALEEQSLQKERALNEEREALQSMARKYEQSVSSGSPDEDLRNELTRRRRQLERDVEAAQNELQLARRDVIQAISQKLGKVIDQFARDNGYSAIFRIEESDLVFVDPNIMITEIVLEAYNKAYPPK